MLALGKVKLETGVTWSAWERNYVTHVLNASHVGDQAFKTKTKTGMWNSTVATQIAIPPVIFFIQAHLQHTFVQNVQTLFTLGTTNDLTDTRSQNVHCCNGFTVFVKAHVERLMSFG